MNTAMFGSRQPWDAQLPIDETAIAIFDSRIDDLPVLLAGLRPGVSAYVLDPDRDGIEQISELIYQQPTASLTLIGFGFPGGLQLGAGKLELNSLARYAPYLRSWFRTADVSQLALLACYVATGDAGLEFVERLASLTGAEVNAPAMPVGNGQWPTMATQTFRPAVLETYKHTLTWVSTS